MSCPVYDVIKGGRLGPDACVAEDQATEICWCVRRLARWPADAGESGGGTRSHWPDFPTVQPALHAHKRRIVLPIELVW